MDELWEMLTLLQTGKTCPAERYPIYGRKYWDEVLNWKAMVRWGMINEDEYRCCSSPIPWTKRLSTSVPGSRNTTWTPTRFCRLTDPQLPTNCLVSIVYGMDQRLLHSLHYGVYNLGPKPFQPGRIWEDGENMKLQTGGKNFFRKAMLATVAFVGLVAFTVRRVHSRMTTAAASAASPRRTTNCTKPSSITAEQQAGGACAARIA